jgi:hypothetical protein
MEKLQENRVELLKTLKDPFQLIGVIENEIAIHETIAHIENVVIRFGVKYIAQLSLIVVLNFLFDNEGHVREWEVQFVVKDDPVVINSIELYARLFPHATLV